MQPLFFLCGTLFPRIIASEASQLLAFDCYYYFSIFFRCCDVGNTPDGKIKRVCLSFKEDEALFLRYPLSLWRPTLWVRNWRILSKNQRTRMLKAKECPKLCFSFPTEEHKSTRGTQQWQRPSIRTKLLFVSRRCFLLWHWSLSGQWWVEGREGDKDKTNSASES